jgi:uncharacterized protein (DUF362 family)
LEDNGPSNGELVPMDVVIAVTNPLATDMIVVSVMGFEPDEIPIFDWANKAGMQSQCLEEIRIRGEEFSTVMMFRFFERWEL